MKKLFVLLPALLILASCNPNVPSSELPSEEPGPSSEDPIPQEREVTIDFTNELSGVDISQGINNIATLNNMFVTDDNVFKTLHSVNCSKVYFDKGGLKFGSSSSSGTLLIESNYDINNIEVVGHAYFSEYLDTWTDPEHPTPVFNADDNVKFSLTDKDEINYLSQEAFSKDNSMQEFPFTASKSFTIGNDPLGGRLIINSITFTYLYV